MLIAKKEVFDPCELVAETEDEKAWFSEKVFDAILNRAREGDVKAVEWLVKNHFLSVRKGPS